MSLNRTPVAVVAVATPGQGTVVHWVGDCRAYGWNGEQLRLYTTDHTVGQQLRVNGVALELAAEHDNWVRTTLSHAVVATVYEIEIPPAELVLLTTDGVHDQVHHETLVVLLRQHQDDSQGLANALVSAAVGNDEGYRDDATALVPRRCTNQTHEAQCGWPVRFLLPRWIETPATHPRKSRQPARGLAPGRCRLRRNCRDQARSGRRGQ